MAPPKTRGLCVADNSESERRRGPGRPFAPGQSGNPGGRPRKLAEIERMLDEEHRGVEHMKYVFSKLRDLALEGDEKGVYWKGALVNTEIVHDPAYMKLYLDRVLGPVRELMSDAEIAELLRDAPQQVVEWFSRLPAPLA
ncbi:MAG TPA: DUF5681 domain-containing protein [Gemmatimonadales bacterium]